MSEESSSTKSKHPHMSQWSSEPIPMSFISPQVLASYASGNFHHLPNSKMNTANSLSMPKENTQYDKNHKSNQMQAVKLPTTNTATASSSSSSDSEALKPLPPLPIDMATFKGFKFVTLDGLQLDTRNVYDKISGTFQWEHCEVQEDRCVSFIHDECEKKRVFLIASGSLGQHLVPKIHNLPQVYAIYIYCANLEFHQKWAQQYQKIRVVCNNDDLFLIPQFAVDVAQANIDWGNALLKQGSRDKAREKFQLASDKLINYARHHDQAMDAEITKKLEECK